MEGAVDLNRCAAKPKSGRVPTGSRAACTQSVYPRCWVVHATLYSAQGIVYRARHGIDSTKTADHPGCRHACRRVDVDGVARAEQLRLCEGRGPRAHRGGRLAHALHAVGAGQAAQVAALRADRGDHSEDQFVHHERDCRGDLVDTRAAALPDAAGQHGQFRGGGGDGLRSVPPAARRRGAASGHHRQHRPDRRDPGGRPAHRHDRAGRQPPGHHQRDPE